MANPRLALPAARPPVTSALAPYFSRTRGDIKPGAHRLQWLLQEHLEEGCLSIPSLLVAGTNGKGTTCAILESCLRAMGHTTGLYTSPHLVHPTERIRINGLPITEDVLAQEVARVEDAARRFLPDATFFEISTAAALLTFKRFKVAHLVCEVGLGGRYDSTNAIAPSVSVLTTVGLDHVEILGDTLEKIATDKAFVSRQGRPFVVGALTDAAWRGVSRTVDTTGARVVDASEDLSAPFSRVESHVAAHGPEWLRLNASNLRVALHALAAYASEASLPVETITESSLLQGVARTFWPGRFDARCFQGVPFLFDGAHNSHGFSLLGRQLVQSGLARARLVAVYGSLSDKDWTAFLPELTSRVSRCILTQPTSPRAVAPAQLAAATAVAEGCDAQVEPDLREALIAASAWASEHNGTVLVTGSLALVGEVFETLGLDPFEPLRTREDIRGNG